MYILPLYVCMYVITLRKCCWINICNFKNAIKQQQEFIKNQYFFENIRKVLQIIENNQNE